MPELPEVESARTLCETHCVGATVTAVAFLEDGTFDEKIFAGTTAKAFRSALLGRTLASAKRLGKHMWWEMAGGGGSTSASHSPLFHFGMTGAFSVRGEGARKYKSFEVDTTSWPRGSPSSWSTSTTASPWRTRTRDDSAAFVS